MHRPALAVAIPLLLLLVFGEASAHAMLDHAEPRLGNKVKTAPHEVRLWFTQKLEPAFSTITVTNATGERVDSGKVRISGDQMSISLRPSGGWNIPCDVAGDFRGHAYDRWQFRVSSRAVKQESSRVGSAAFVGCHSRDTLHRYGASDRNAGLPNGSGRAGIDFVKGDGIGCQVANSPDNVDQLGNRGDIGRDLASVGGRVDERTAVR